MNGDRYSDVIVGAPDYDNGQTDEGAAFIYYGSANGINSMLAVVIEVNQASAHLGYSVSKVGDVNGDGYSDVIVGAGAYTNGEMLEGASFVYYGSASGISTTAATTVEGNQVAASFGTSVSGAGDVNGNGYSDVIVGVPNYDNGQEDEGAAFVYHGLASSYNIATSVSATSICAGTDNGSNITINTPPATLSVTITQPTCTIATGTITVSTPTGSGITYSINNTNYQTSNVFNNVAPGKYNVTAKNSSGCVSAAAPAVVNAQTAR